MSDLQIKLSEIHGYFTEDVSNIVRRDLLGGSTSCINAEGYTGNVAGADVPNQNLWPLSITEASQLKASVRTYAVRAGDSAWLLRSPGGGYYITDSKRVASVSNGRQNGVINPDGITVEDNVYNLENHNYAARPALYLNSSSSIFTSALSNAMSKGTLNIGAYDETPKVTDSQGYTWDIVGINNGATKKGIVPPRSGYATLLLSNSSAKKFGFPNQTAYYAGRMHGRYNFGSIQDTDAYSTSDLRKAINEATAISAQDEYLDKILPRDLLGGALYEDETERVAGPGVNHQGLWPLSVTEAQTLTNQQRIFGYRWWLRSPGNSPHVLSVNVTLVYDSGSVNTYGDYVDSRSYAAVRPAFYLDLSSSIFDSLPTGWQSKVGDKRTVTFNPNGGAVSKTSTSVGNSVAIGTLPTPVRDCYKFLGWFTSKTGGSELSASTIVTSDLTAYAQWQVLKPDTSAPESIVNHADFKSFVAHTTPAKKSVKKKKSATVKLTAYKNVTVKSATLDKKGKKLKLKVTKAANSIKVKAGTKKGKAKITITLTNGNKKTITVTIK